MFRGSAGARQKVDGQVCGWSRLLSSELKVPPPPPMVGGWSWHPYWHVKRRFIAYLDPVDGCVMCECQEEVIREDWTKQDGCVVGSKQGEGEARPGLGRSTDRRQRHSPSPLPEPTQQTTTTQPIRSRTRQSYAQIETLDTTHTRLGPSAFPLISLDRPDRRPSSSLASEHVLLSIPPSLTASPAPPSPHSHFCHALDITYSDVTFLPSQGWVRSE